MKRFLIFLIVFFSSLMIIGCTRTVYVYPEQNFPTLEAPNKVVSNYDSYIWKKCLYINDHNTSLCNDDLNKVITTVNQLRINEKTCSKTIKIYNEFKKMEKSQTRKKDKYSF